MKKSELKTENKLLIKEVHLLDKEILDLERVIEGLKSEIQMFKNEVKNVQRVNADVEYQIKKANKELKDNRIVFLTIKKSLIYKILNKLNIRSILIPDDYL